LNSDAGRHGSGGPPSQPPLPEKIDHYQVIRKIGRGGQGDVYLAHDPNLDIDVAVKVLLADYRTEEILNRFTLEARTAVRLTAENIVRIYNFNPSYPCLVMEYCGDGDLNGLIKSRRRMPLSRAVKLIRQICNALIAAHERAEPILHRDLKPGNVLFQKDVPKVADFGLAKVLGDASSGLTSTRGMMGTVAYTSPEQLKDASSVDHRTDIWSVGVMLYELLTFRGPFDRPGDDYVNVAIRVRTEPPADPPYEIPDPLWQVIERCLEKNPDNRFGSARELARALDAALATIPDADEILVPPEETLGELDFMATRIADSLGSGSTDQAHSLVERMREISPDDSLVRYWDRQVREVVESEAASADSTPLAGAELLARRVSSIEGLVARRDYREARRRIGELLIEDPDNATVHELILRVNQDEQTLLQALAEAHEAADPLRAAGDLAGVEEVWRRIDELFPDCADIKAELAVASRELELESRREGRAAAERQAAPLLEAGDLAGALEVWDRHLERHPEDGEASSARTAIHEELTARTRAERLTALWEEVQELRQADNLEPALERVVLILEEDPGSEEAAALAGSLRAAVEERRRQRQQAALHQELVQEVSALEERLEGQRDRKVDGSRERINESLEAARQALTGELEEMIAAREQLTETRQAAESRLADLLRERRHGLRDRLDAACKLLGQRPDPTGLETAAEQALRQATEETVAELGTVWPPDSAGDPVEPLLRADRALQEAAEAVGRERSELTKQSRKRAGEAITEASEAVSALRSRAGSDEATRLDQRLTTLRERAASDSVSALEQVSREAEALKIETGSVMTSLSWNAATDLRRALDDSLDLATEDASDRLRELVVRAARALEELTDSGPEDANSLASLGRELQAELDACRRQRSERFEETSRRWRAAEEETSQLVRSDLEREFTARVEAARQAGAAALAASRWPELQRRAAELDGLAREGRVRTAWIEHREAVETLEASGEEEAGGDLRAGSRRQELLNAYRVAAAEGSADELRSLGAKAEKAGRKGHGAGARARRERIDALLEPAKRVRELNRRYAPAALERFEQAVAAYRRAGTDAEPAEVERLAAELGGAHDALLQPPPAWRRIAVAASAVLALAAVTVVVWNVFVSGTSEVTLVSPFGDVRIVQVTRDGSRVDDLPAEAMTITPAGVGWALEPGDYVVTTENGLTVPFVAPRSGPVLIPSDSVDHRSELLKELELEEPENPEEP
jgi:serine/threonine protein kinase